MLQHHHHRHHHHRQHHHQSLNHESRWGTTDDFETGFHYLLSGRTCWSPCRPVSSLMVSSHLFLCLLCFLPSPPFHCAKQINAGWFCPYLMNVANLVMWLQFAPLRLLDLFVFQLSARSWYRLPHWQHGVLQEVCRLCSSASLPQFVFYSGALLWGPIIYKHAGK